MPRAAPSHRPAFLAAMNRQARAEAEARRPGARRRGYDTEFQREAAAYLKAHPTCTCGRPAVLVRHKISIRRRPDLRMDPANWLPGCQSCNAKDTWRDRKKEG